MFIRSCETAGIRFIDECIQVKLYDDEMAWQREKEKEKQGIKQQPHIEIDLKWFIYAHSLPIQSNSILQAIRKFYYDIFFNYFSH